MICQGRHAAEKMVAVNGVHGFVKRRKTQEPARLDRLGSAREIAQIGAVLGRGFSHALLQAVAGVDEPALRAARQSDL